MNPLYQQLMGGVGAQVPAPSRMQRISMAMAAMRNPAAFVKQQFPDVPDEMLNNPQQILGYLQQTRGIGNEQIQQILGQYPMGGG
jgi:hypothetical protein